MTTDLMSETGIEELRVLVAIANNTPETALDDLSVEDAITLLRACRASEWDVTPDDLTEAQRRNAIEHGEVPNFVEWTEATPDAEVAGQGLAYAPSKARVVRLQCAGGAS